MEFTVPNWLLTIIGAGLGLFATLAILDFFLTISFSIGYP